MIEGVYIGKLKKIEDSRGKVLHMLRRDSPIFSGFGEVYFSVVNNGAVKAWRKHLRMTQNFAVPVGKVRLVIYDDRAGSATNGNIHEIELGEENYCLVKIPPRLWYGFKGISLNPALIANCSDIPHEQDEVERVDHLDTKIPYLWK